MLIRRAPLSLLALLSTLALQAQAGDVIETSGFTTCLEGSDIVVDKMHLKYDRATSKLDFDLSGVSLSEQYVTASVQVKAYGRDVYSSSFDPCVEGIAQLCPVPKGAFSADNVLTLSSKMVSSIPAIVFSIPDLDGIATMTLISKGSGDHLACLKSVVDNGKSTSIAAAKYATAGVAAAALVLSSFSALGASSGTSTSAAGASPNFGDVMFWFQSIAMDGMLSVSYPSVYRSFTDNFQWSTGLLTWEGMQSSIDSFRSSTGGNTTEMSIYYLMNNVTLVYDSSLSESAAANTSVVRRGLDYGFGTIFPRDNEDDDSSNNKVLTYVNGVKAKVETLKIPSANTFMTVLLIFCIVLASVAVSILLFKVILEIWALFGSFPKSLTGFRKRYWMFLLTTIVRIILILYGTWTLYCMYQFKNGDSWGCHVLSAVTLTIFTGVLAFFGWRIATIFRHSKKTENGKEELFLHKPYMRKYGLFYDQFKSDFWWTFVPLIIYAFAKGAILALGDGKGLVQTVGLLCCELLLLIMLIVSRPYNTKAGNVLNIVIASVRVLSVICLMIFVEQLHISADTKTVTGVALLAIQSTLTAALAICIIVNAIHGMCKKSPSARRRAEEEKMHDADLTPLDARNSMLFGSYGHDGKGQYQQTPVQDQFYYNETPATIPMQEMDQGFHARNVSEASHQGLMLSAAPISMIGGRNRPQSNYEDYPGQKNRHQERDSGPYEDYPGQFPPTNQIPASPRKQQQQEIGVARAY